MLQHRALSRFGWFSGVFLPTFLTIVGVVYYLRLGYVVGTLGIFYTIMAILLAESVVVATAISMVGISRHKLGPGGAVGLIYHTLGDTAARVVGLPLFIAATLSVVFYIFGFSEAWRFLFPDHSSLVVSLVVLVIIFLLTYTTIQTAVKVEILIFGLILFSILSIFTGQANIQYGTIVQESVTMSTFWHTFAIFFPAVTGILAGVGLSGQLHDPKHSIAKGIYAAIGSTALLYFVTAIWLGITVAPSQLISNSLILIDIASIPIIVVIGILAATFSSALVTLIAASRLLQTLSNHSYVPFSNIFRKRKKGEPRNAIKLISIIALVLIVTGSLDSVAVLLSIFFLITYAIINYGYYKKHAKTIPSKLIALFGMISTVLIILLIHPLLGALALLLTGAAYYLSLRYNLHILDK